MFQSSGSFNVLYTTDIAKTHSFYRQLGLEIRQVKSDKVVVTFGSFDLHFILNTEEPFDEYRYISEPGKYGQGVIFYIETDSLYTDSEMITRAGGKVKSEIFKNLWGYEELLFEDPNGYKFALFQELK